MMNVDQTSLKFNQASIILLLVIAFLFNATWLVAAVAAVMVVGTLWPQAGLFKQFYARVVKPAGWLKPTIIADDPQQHLFAQGLGGLFLVLSTAALWLGQPVIGWVLAAIVMALASINLFFGFCLGCFLYYQLGRAGVKPTLPSWQPVQTDK
jgi:hypothetical protein